MILEKNVVKKESCRQDLNNFMALLPQMYLTFTIIFNRFDPSAVFQIGTSYGFYMKSNTRLT